MNRFPEPGTGRWGGISPSSRGLRSGVFVMVALGANMSLSWYVIFRGITFLQPGYDWPSRAFAVLLVLAEFFLSFHAVGYLLSIARSSRRYRTVKDHFFVSVSHQPVAVVVATFNEDPEIVEDTLASVSNLDYPAKNLYLLDDSTNQNLQSRTERLAGKYHLKYVHRSNRRGYKAGALNDLLPDLPEKYLAVFDADQKPVRDFLDQTTSLLEENPKLAFVQTPQFYHNAGQGPVALGAACQQVVFYEYICEGKSVANAMFSCGSNVVYRVEALRDVGGFEEQTVTEDFATGLKLHLNGWQSLYYNHVFVRGLGPESLAGYWTQQMRWAMGTIGLFKRMLALLVTRPRALKTGQWWEYSLSGSYYLVGWANFILLLCPIAFLLFDIRPMIAEIGSYLAAFLPYLSFSIANFYFSMGRRGHKPASMLVGQALSFNSFWVLMNAAVMALLNVKRPFGVTPKGTAASLPLKYLLPHILLLAASLAAMFAGVSRIAHGQGAVVIFNMVWAGYHMFILGTVFYFNRSFASYKLHPVFLEA